MRMEYGDDIIGAALREDIGPGDVTVQYFTDPGAHCSAQIIAREPAIAAGVEIAGEVFRRVSSELAPTILSPSGTALVPGDVALSVRGPAGALLTAERTALNFLQHLSGIATLTRRFVDAVGPHRARILDTRKTTPGLRALEKGAVRAGGGTNHRMGLHDRVMVKDNHLIASADDGALAQAIRCVRQDRPSIKVEIEADTLKQVSRFLGIEGVDVILLDNMSLADMAEAVRIRGNLSVALEASGGVTLDRITEIAATGVDFISVGALTHSVRAIDFSLELSNGDT